MLAVVKEKVGPGVTVKDVPRPEAGEGEVLVKVKYSSICGTDIGIYDWIPWAAAHIKPPKIIGHELVGEVVEIKGGGETVIRPGDLVSSETHIFCLNCYQCKAKNYHVCENMELFGIGRDGGFAEYAVIPIKTAWRNDPKIDPVVMSVQEPLGNAVHAVTKAEVKDKRVLIMGLGPTGLSAGGVAKAYGASEVVGVNNTPYRRALAERTGWFTRVLPATDLREQNAFDAVLEMSGNRLGIQAALEAVRVAGRLIAFGIPKEEVKIDWGKYLINKEISILSVFGRQVWTTWEETTRLLVSGALDLKKIITHRFPLRDFEEAMRVMKSQECGKVILEP